MEMILQSVSESAHRFDFLLGVGVMLAYLIVDAMYAYYTLAVAQTKPVHAATSGALMHFLLALGVLSYVENYLYIIPIAIGSWFGTYIIVRRAQSKESNV